MAAVEVKTSPLGDTGSCIADRVAAPVAPSLDELRDGYFRAVAAATFGLVRFAEGHYQLGPITLLRFGTPHFEHPAWVFPIVGGVLVGRAGGALRIGWGHDHLYCSLEGYQPRLPDPLYRLTQLPFHHGITRVGLLQMRGRLPAAGIPAEPWRRLLAGALDVAAAAAVALVMPRAGRAARGVLLVGALVATQTAIPAVSGGRSPGAWVAGTRLCGIDGERARLLQLVIRLFALPRGMRALRDRHDELAGLDVLLSRSRETP